MFGARAGFLPRQRALLATDGVLFAQDRVRVTARQRNFRIPGQFADRATTWLSGAVVITSRGFECSLGDDYTLAAAAWAPVPAGARGFAALEPDGLRVHFEVDRIVSGGTGTLEFHYRLRPEVREISAALRTPTAPLPIEQAAFASMTWRFLG